MTPAITHLRCKELNLPIIAGNQVQSMTLHAALDEVAHIQEIHHGTERSAHQASGNPILQRLSQLPRERDDIVSGYPEHVQLLPFLPFAEGRKGKNEGGEVTDAGKVQTAAAGTPNQPVGIEGITATPEPIVHVCPSGRSHDPLVHVLDPNVYLFRFGEFALVITVLQHARIHRYPHVGIGLLPGYRIIVSVPLIGFTD